MVVMGQFDKPYTYTFLGSVLSPIMAVLFSHLDEIDEEPTEDDIQNCPT